MKSFWAKLHTHRFSPLAIIAWLVLGLSFLTRLILFVRSWYNLELNIKSLVGIFAIGFLYDVVVASFICLPIAIYIWLMKDSWFRKKWNNRLLKSIFFFTTLLLVLNAFAEISFWEEFNVRYNFIAVDYLIYTNEVLGNIWQSYNMPLLLSLVLLLTIGIFFLYRKRLPAAQSVSMRFLPRTAFFFSFLLIPVAGYYFMHNQFRQFSRNNYVNELAGNGIYEFGSAFRHNEIDYTKFYPVLSDSANFAYLRSQLGGPGIQFTADSLSVARHIVGDSIAKHYNIVMISVESLSSDYMAYFGNKENITPKLDSLIPHSLFFSRCYASGTRTVRGLEALSLSIPPTPGQSIVRRPHNEDLFSLGDLLLSKGYDVNYVYGGNSYFDNMGYFFSHNGYKVTDIRDIPKEKVHHETIWGVADEDALDILLQKCEQGFQSGKPFFNHLMTVSNHRPYTYPEGRIDRPSSSQSIQGAVKYTDYSINRFLMQARGRAWFDKTIFVVVADHCSRSAGKTDLPVTRYHIPCLIYAPGIVKPEINQRLFSQIDLAPTLLGIMNMNYQSKFMGHDIFKTDTIKDRIFISTYQQLGFIQRDTMVILQPPRKLYMYAVNFQNGSSDPIPLDPGFSARAIAWYQSASYLFKKGKYAFR